MIAKDVVCKNGEIHDYSVGEYSDRTTVWLDSTEIQNKNMCNWLEITTTEHVSGWIITTSDHAIN